VAGIPSADGRLPDMRHAPIQGGWQINQPPSSDATMAHVSYYFSNLVLWQCQRDVTHFSQDSPSARPVLPVPQNGQTVCVPPSFVVGPRLLL
jgi:hypothetical protein